MPKDYKIALILLYFRSLPFKSLPLPRFCTILGLHVPASDPLPRRARLFRNASSLQESCTIWQKNSSGNAIPCLIANVGVYMLWAVSNIHIFAPYRKKIRLREHIIGYGFLKFIQVKIWQKHRITCRPSLGSCGKRKKPDREFILRTFGETSLSIRRVGKLEVRRKPTGVVHI